MAEPLPAEPDSSAELTAALDRLSKVLPDEDVIAGDLMVRSHRSDGSHADLYRSDLRLVVEAARRAAQPGPDAEQPGVGIDPTIAAGYRLEDIRGYSPRDLGFGADGHTDEPGEG